MVPLCNFGEISTPPWVFFMFFKLYKWYQIAQSVTYESKFRSKSLYRTTGRYIE